MKTLSVAAILVAASSFATAEKMIRKGVIPRSQLFGTSSNAMNIFGRQTCGLGTDCNNGICCEILHDCCQDSCCDPGFYCDETPIDPDRPCVCFGSGCPDGDDNDDEDSSSAAPSISSSALVFPSSSSSFALSFGSSTSDLAPSSFSTSGSGSDSGSVSGGGGSFSAATGIHHDQMSWISALGLAVAGGIGMLAVFL